MELTYTVESCIAKVNCNGTSICLQIFARMTPYNLGRAACVCRKWRYTVRNPVFWRNACLKAWQVTSLLLRSLFHCACMQNVKFKCGFSMKIFGVVENYKILQSKYDGSWRKMWLSRPRIRTDGKMYLTKCF